MPLLGTPLPLPLRQRAHRWVAAIGERRVRELTGLGEVALLRALAGRPCRRIVHITIDRDAPPLPVDEAPPCPAAPLPLAPPGRLASTSAAAAPRKAGMR